MLVLLLVASCGRIAFDPRVDSDVATSDVTPAVRCEASTPFTSIQRIAELGSPQSDGGLRLSEDELVAYFDSARAGAQALFIASRASRADAFAVPINAGFGALWPSVTPDQKTIVYSAMGATSYDVLSRTRATTAAGFKNPMPAGGTINTAATESGTFLMGATLYFQRSGASYDLYRSPWPAGGGTVAPITELNSAGDDQAPAPSRDELTLYFGRDIGTGDDIMMTSRAATTGPFAAPQPVIELNTASDENPTWLSPDQCRLYFESNRSGDFELYVAERAP